MAQMYTWARFSAHEPPFKFQSGSQGVSNWYPVVLKVPILLWSWYVTIPRLHGRSELETRKDDFKHVKIEVRMGQNTKKMIEDFCPLNTQPYTPFLPNYCMGDLQDIHHVLPIAGCSQIGHTDQNGMPTMVYLKQGTFCRKEWKTLLQHDTLKTLKHQFSHG